MESDILLFSEKYLNRSGGFFFLWVRCNPSSEMHD